MEQIVPYIHDMTARASNPNPNDWTSEGMITTNPNDWTSEGMITTNPNDWII